MKHRIFAIKIGLFGDCVGGVVVVVCAVVDVGCKLWAFQATPSVEAAPPSVSCC